MRSLIVGACQKVKRIPFGPPLKMPMNYLGGETIVELAMSVLKLVILHPLVHC